MTEEEKKLFGDFANKVLDRGIECHDEYKAKLCAWVIEKLFLKIGKDEDWIDIYLEDIGNKELIEDWGKLKNNLSEYFPGENESKGRIN